MAPSFLDEEEGGVTKVVSGQWSEINKADVVDVAEMLANFIPGFKAAAAGTGLSALGATWRAASKREKLEIALGLRSLEECSGKSCAVREGLDNIDVERNHTIAGGVVAGGGALAGATIGSALFPGVGTLAGLVIGGVSSMIVGTAAYKVYDSIMVDKTEDTLGLVAKVRLAQKQAIEEAQKTGQPVDAGIPEEVVLAAMITNLPKARREEITRITGVDNFSELVANDELDKLRKLMNNPSVDNILRADSGIFYISPEDPTQSVAVQVAKRINAGDLDANELLFNQEGRLQLSFLAEGNKLRAQGVAPVAPGDPSLPLPPPDGRAAQR
jgi:hypothetical protein